MVVFKTIASWMWKKNITPIVLNVVLSLREKDYSRTSLRSKKNWYSTKAKEKAAISEKSVPTGGLPMSYTMDTYNIPLTERQINDII